MGCARIQKTFTLDFLTKKAVKNYGQVPSYFVEQSHPAIIDPAVFEMVQREMERRIREGGRYSGVSIFSGKIRCGECGGYFRPKVWHSTDRYRRTVYSCNNKYDGQKCQTRHVTEAISAKEAQYERLAVFERMLKVRTAPVVEFDSQLWASMVECVTVGKGMTVVFRDGTEMRV